MKIKMSKGMKIKMSKGMIFSGLSIAFMFAQMITESLSNEQDEEDMKNELKAYVDQKVLEAQKANQIGTQK